MKKIKQLTCIILILSIISTTLIAHASAPSELSGAYSNDLVVGAVFSVQLDDLGIRTAHINSFDEASQIDHAMTTSTGNFERALQLLIDIPFEEMGLLGVREHFMAELFEMKEEGLMLENIYAVEVSASLEVLDEAMRSMGEDFVSILPPQRNMIDETWPMFRGLSMRASTAISSSTYILQERGSRLERWIRGFANLVLVWNPYRTVGISFALVGSIQPTYIAHTGDRVDVTAREQRRTRVISVRDIDGIWGSTLTYRAIMSDQEVVTDLVTTYTPGQVGRAPSSTMTPAVLKRTDNFGVRSIIQQDVYNHYRARRQLGMHGTVRTIPRAILLFQ